MPITHAKMTTSNQKIYYASALSSYLVWGFLPIALKYLDDYPSGTIVYFRVAFAVMLLFILSFTIRRKAFRLTIKKLLELQNPALWSFIILSGIATAINWLSFVYTVNHVGIQTGAFAYLICPIIATFLGFLLLKEPLKRPHQLAIILSSISCIILGSGNWQNLGYALLIAFSYAFYMILQRKLRAFDKLTLLTLQLLVSFLVIAPFFEFLIVPETPILNVRFIGVTLIISAFFTIFPLFLNIYALKELTAGAVGILSYLNPFINFVLAFFFFREATNGLQITAYLLIFISVIIYNSEFIRRELLRK